MFQLRVGQLLAIVAVFGSATAENQVGAPLPETLDRVLHRTRKELLAAADLSNPLIIIMFETQCANVDVITNFISRAETELSSQLGSEPFELGHNCDFDSQDDARHVTVTIALTDAADITTPAQLIEFVQFAGIGDNFIMDGHEASIVLVALNGLVYPVDLELFRGVSGSGQQGRETDDEDQSSSSSSKKGKSTSAKEKKAKKAKKSKKKNKKSKSKHTRSTAGVQLLSLDVNQAMIGFISGCVVVGLVAGIVYRTRTHVQYDAIEGQILEQRQPRLDDPNHPLMLGPQPILS